MRWIWFDRFEVFESGRRAVAVKNITLAEDHLHDHFPGFPVAPASLLIEGMAQTAGILVGEARDFQEKVILAKIKRAEFDRLILPGETVRFEAEIDHLTDQAASTRGVVRVGPEEVGRVDIVFSHIDNNLRGQEFPEDNFVFTDQFLSMLDTFRRLGTTRVEL